MHWGSKLSSGRPQLHTMERKVPSYLGRRARSRVLPSFSCSTAPARMAVAAATGAAAWALLAMACGCRSASGSVAPRSVSHPIQSATICLTARTRARCLHYGAACWAALLRVHVSAMQRWFICALKRAAHSIVHT